jgi:hypothetical protein
MGFTSCLPNLQCQKRKDKRYDIVLETKPKRFGIVPEFVLLRQIVSIWSKIGCPRLIEMCSFDGADSGTNSDVLVSFLLDVGTFVERMLLYCLDIKSQLF